MKDHPENKDSELELWRQSTEGVQPLNTRARVQAPPPRIDISRRQKDEHEEVLQASMSAYFEPEDFNTGDEVQFRRDGVSAATLRKLRRGQFAVEATADLHGLTRQQGHQATLEFLAKARRQGWRCIKIIHGKGLRSAQGQPVLKRRVEITLQHHDQVLAYCSAPTWAGGHGAVLILLRKD